jgi:CheY-like chemotaxis protein/HPt (histidine-containing phosphotransfer) domain-containing protein
MLEVGQIVDRYRVRAALGAGGMARVYLVQHTILGSEHALKVHTATKRSIKRRFAREGRLQARLHHPNVVPVTDVIDLGERAGLVMAYVAGPTLSGLLRRHRLPMHTAAALFRGLALGLGHAHERGVVHRDLKPSNVLIQVGPTLLPMVTDFGLAKSLVDEGTMKTRSGATLGTPSYMPPEQIRDASRVDHRADLYGLGCLLYAMLVGRPPFRGSDVIDLLDRINRRDYTDPRTLVDGLPDRLVDLLQDLLHPEPEGRPESCERVVERLDGALIGRMDEGTVSVARALRDEARERLALSDGQAGSATRDTELRVLAVAPGPATRSRIVEALKQCGLPTPEVVPDAPQGLARLIAAARHARPFRLVVVDDGPRGGLLAGRVARDPRLEKAVVVRADAVSGDAGVLAEALAAALAPSAASGSASGKGSSGGPEPQGRVLIVEDNLVQRTLLAHLLRRLGWSPVEAASGRDALVKAREAPPRVVLLDFALGDAQGDQVIRRLRAAGVDAPVVVATAQDAPEVRMAVERAGAAAFLTKPLRGPVLRRTLEQVLSRSRTPVVLDETVLESLRELIGASVDEVVGLFLQDLPAEVAAWREARRDAHPDELSALARRLKPAAAHLGATALVEACDELARLGADVTHADLQGQVDGLIGILQATAEALRDQVVRAA